MRLIVKIDTDKLRQALRSTTILGNAWYSGEAFSEVLLQAVDEIDQLRAEKERFQIALRATVEQWIELSQAIEEIRKRGEEQNGF